MQICINQSFETAKCLELVAPQKWANSIFYSFCLPHLSQHGQQGVGANLHNKLVFNRASVLAVN